LNNKIKLIIWDLDETIANTRHLKKIRDNRKWDQVFKMLSSVNHFSGIIDVYQTCLLKYKQAVVTNSPRKYATGILDKFCIEPDLLVAYHDTRKHKPDPEPFLKCFEHFSIQSNACISIGDTLKDYECSQNANCHFIGVTWGEYSKEQFENLEVKYIAKKPDDILKMINDIEKI